MYADFFNQNKRPRLRNPTFSSGNIFSTMMYPVRPTDAVDRQIRALPQNTMPRHDSVASPNLSPAQELHLNRQNSMGSNYLKQQPVQKRRSSSNLSSLGSSSLKYLTNLSSRQVSLSQQKDFDIINLKNRQRVPNPSPSPDHKVTAALRVQFDPESYMGVSTAQKNAKVERLSQFRSRPYYLNNADEIYL